MSEQNSDLSDPSNADRKADQALLQLVSFVIGADDYAIPISAVQEINRTIPIAPVPHSPPCVQGVADLRGKAIPVIDLRQRFGKPINEATNDTRIIVARVRAGQETHVLGLMVDQVNRVLRIASDTVEPAKADDADHTCVQGICRLDERPLALLSPDKLFSQTELRLISSACLAADTAVHAA